jgi:hypothetical protein
MKGALLPGRARMRRYYSVRTGKNSGAVKFSIEQLRSLFLAAYEDFSEKNYFQEHFGYWCVDDQEVHGKLGANIPGKVTLHIRKDNLWPIGDKCGEYSEDDVFDMIEFLYEHISKPLEGRYHSYGGCGYHYSSFDRDTGRSEFRAAINAFLRDYSDGFELSLDGEILTLGEPTLAPLETAKIPTFDPKNVDSRIELAVRKFRRYRSSVTDRRDAIRDLADVFEFLRPRLKKILTSKDEADLFNIANNFAIRHHDGKQKENYDKSIWLSWMFYFYLATIHASLRLLQKAKTS